LIAFAAIEQLNLLHALLSSIVIPPAVAREKPSIATLPSWLRVAPLQSPLPEAVLRQSLGDGEREAVALALEIKAERILPDDRPARRVAQELGLVVTGTAGVLLAAKRHELIAHVRPFVDALVEKSFYIGTKEF
jgi:predicted nucleic acid-binding protein